MKNKMCIFLDQVKEILLDIVFPKSKKVVLLENLSSEELVLNLKSSDDIIIDDFTILPLFNYREQNIRKIIWEIKYHKNQKLVRLMCEVINEILPTRLENEFMYHHFKDFIIIPIPLSQKRHAFRGYNQTQLIAEELHKTHNFKYLDALEKTKETSTQTKLRRQDRLKNQKGAFRIKKEFINQIKNHNVLLLDDVVTTGATLLEAKKLLVESGDVRRVVGMTIAH